MTFNLIKIDLLWAKKGKHVKKIVAQNVDTQILFQH